MQRNPNAIRRFLKGWFKTVAFMRDHKNETVALTQPVMQVSTAVVAKTYDVEMPIYFTDGHFDRKAVEIVKKSLIDMGQIDRMPDNKDLFTEKFLE
jgi:NitT/TauT family transport system substrate-binding protein